MGDLFGTSPPSWTSRISSEACCPAKTASTGSWRGKRPSHTAPAARFRNELEDYMSEDYADETLKTIVSWGRYAELFEYDAIEGRLYLPS